MTRLLTLIVALITLGIAINIHIITSRMEKKFLTYKLGSVFHGDILEAQDIMNYPPRNPND